MLCSYHYFFLSNQWLQSNIYNAISVTHNRLHHQSAYPVSVLLYDNSCLKGAITWPLCWCQAGWDGQTRGHQTGEHENLHVASSLVVAVYVLLLPSRYSNPRFLSCSYRALMSVWTYEVEKEKRPEYVIFFLFSRSSEVKLNGC